MIQSDCNLVPNILKPIKKNIEALKIETKSRGVGGGALTIGWNDTPLVLSTLSCLRHSMVSSDHFEIHGDGPESELTLKAFLYVTFSCSFVTFQ